MIQNIQKNVATFLPVNHLELQLLLQLHVLLLAQLFHHFPSHPMIKKRSLTNTRITEVIFFSPLLLFPLLRGRVGVGRSTEKLIFEIAMEYEFKSYHFVK